MGNKLKQIIGIITAMVSIVLLYSLPKVVVSKSSNSEKGLSGGHQANEKAAPPKTASETVKPNSVISEADLKLIEANRKQLGDSKLTKPERIRLLDSLSSRFEKNFFYDSAAIYAEKAAEISGEDKKIISAGDAWFKVASAEANAAQRKENTEKARQWYEKVLTKNPNQATAKVKLALTWVDSENPMKGIGLLREVIAAEPDNELAIYQLGLLSIRSKQFDKAIVRFEKLLSLRTNNSQARYYLALSYMEAGRNQDAIREFSTLKNTEKDPSILASVEENLNSLKSGNPVP